MHAISTLDLNADLGEGGTQDAALFVTGITSANIACGAHAGDGASMAEACALAVRHGVAIGAHPGYADRAHFGRREQVLSSAELAALLDDQLGRLVEIAGRAGAGVRHVKPHGALYHWLNREAEAAEVLLAVMEKHVSRAALLFGPPTGALGEAAARAGRGFVAEGFIDRAYRADGSLVPRGEPGAVLHEEAAIVAQALTLARSGRVGTLCVHGDGPEATRWLRTARAALVAEGFRIVAPG